MEERKDLLATCVCCCVVFLLELTVHQEVEHLALVLHELLILGVLADRIQKGNDALVEFHLMVVSEVDYH